MTAVRAAFDIGGTFTDLVVDDGHTLHRGKVLTTPHAPAAGALAGLDELVARAGLAWPRVSEVVHGTTLVTNALLERRFGVTGLLVTRGFRDVLAMGRQQRYDAYDLRIAFPAPLVPRELRLEIDERTLASGRVVRRVRDDQVVDAARRLVDAGATSLAVCFLHSYREPANEDAAARAVRGAFPHLRVVTSSAVAPEIREYERTVTAAATAAVLPLVDDYLDELAAGLSARGCGGPLQLMQSSAYTAPEASVRAAPITLLESGPAGGARAAATALDSPLRPVLAFDMGGTTAKACLAGTDGTLSLVGELEVAREHRFTSGSGLPLRVPSIDLIEIGAGGGSIAATDRLGLLRIGPESAGAHPGPACYGFGGTLPTVTDANLCLGYLGADAKLAGSVSLDLPAAEEALRGLGDRLGLDVRALALGIHRLVDEQMAAAARAHLVDRGTDPRRVTLVVTGGAGPAHAAGMARLLGCPEVVVPVGAGTASAAGFLGAPAGIERSWSLPSTLAEVDWSRIASLYERLEAEVATALGADRTDGTLRFDRRVDARLVGQVHLLTVPLPALDDSVADTLRTAYRTRFRVDPGDMPMEILTWRCQGTAATPTVSPAVPATGGTRRETTRPVTFDEDGPVPCPVVSRDTLYPGAVLQGPVVVEEAETTTVVPPGDRLEVGETGHLHLTVGGGRRGV